MYIIPRPQTLFENEGSFKLKRNEINSFIDKIREVCN